MQTALEQSMTEAYRVLSLLGGMVYGNSYSLSRQAMQIRIIKIVYILVASANYMDNKMVYILVASLFCIVRLAPQ